MCYFYSILLNPVFISQNIGGMPIKPTNMAVDLIKNQIYTWDLNMTVVNRSRGAIHFNTATAVRVHIIVIITSETML